MVLLGTLLMRLLIIVGTIIGRLLKNIPENMKQTVCMPLGLLLLLLEFKWALKVVNF